MAHDYFSDRELGKKELKSEEITTSVYIGIISIYKKYQKNFSFYYPDTCPDNEMVCGTDVQLLNAAIKAEIPNMETPVNVKWDEDDDIDKYALLDFVEFCYLKIADINESDYHNWFKHYHIFFPETQYEKENYRIEVNQIFERNGIVFYLDSDGMVKRQLPTQLETVLQNLNVKSKDKDLNQLVNTAIENIRKPKEFNRQIALEKVWDAFERLKTFYEPSNKKASAATLVTKIAAGTAQFDLLLDNEFRTLTSIGNDFQIRHFETGKIKITTMKQVDYLFYRMISLIDLCMDKVSNEI
jgi:AbiJ N-terminal domain 4